MARDITSGFETEIDAQSLVMAYFIKAEFDGGDVRVWTGYGDKIFSAETYSGTGNLVGISSVTETQDMSATSVSFTLSGVPSAYVSVALAEDYQWRPITMWVAVLDSAGAIIADPYKIFSGKMDIMEIEDDGDNATISIRAENNLIGLTEAKEWRYTPEDQARLYPADKGFDFVSRVKDQNVQWGT
jgi:hypothetical protein